MLKGFFIRSLVYAPGRGIFVSVSNKVMILANFFCLSCTTGYMMSFEKLGLSISTCISFIFSHLYF